MRGILGGVRRRLPGNETAAEAGEVGVVVMLCCVPLLTGCGLLLGVIIAARTWLDTE